MSQQIRTLHAYIGMLIAPSLLFFASTGLLQIYNLHEAHPGYTPPAVIEALSAVHKDQRFGAHHERPPGGERPHARAPETGAPHEGEEQHADGPHKPRTATMLLKAFFAFVAIGLIVSTLFGIWMGLQQRLRWRAHLALLVVGTLIPAVLAALTT